MIVENEGAPIGYVNHPMIQLRAPSSVRCIGIGEDLTSQIVFVKSCLHPLRVRSRYLDRHSSSVVLVTRMHIFVMHLVFLEP